MLTREEEAMLANQNAAFKAYLEWHDALPDEQRRLVDEALAKQAAKTWPELTVSEAELVDLLTHGSVVRRIKEDGTIERVAPSAWIKRD